MILNIEILERNGKEFLNIIVFMKRLERSKDFLYFV